MTYDGAAVATLVLDAAGKLLAPPQITVHGVFDEAGEAEIAAIASAISEAVSSLTGGDRRKDDAVREAARLALRRSLKASHGKRPLTDIHIVRV
jgi:ribonuclease J